jgi:hypothetical protein
MRRWAAGAAVLLVAACGGAPQAADPGPSPSPAAPPTVGTAAPAVAGIAAEAVQLRTDVAAGGRFQVRITATGEEPFSVTSVALDSPGFAPVPPVVTSTDFRPGQVVDLRTPLGPLRCDVAAEPAAALLTVARDGGAPEEVRVPLAAEVLGRIHAAGCAAEALSQVVTVAVTALRPEGEELVGRLTLTRGSGSDEVRAVRVARSVLMDVQADLPLVLAANAREVEAGVRFAPATCEPHVLAETKQPFRFPLGIEVDGREEVVVDLPVTAEVRGQLQDLVDRVCR